MAVAALVDFGEVTDDSPVFLVRFNGEADPVPGVVPLASYSPATNDHVVLLKVGITWFAAGSYTP